MTRILWCVVSLGLAFGLGRVASAQSFELTMTGAPPEVEDAPDTTVTLNPTGQLVTSGLAAGDPGAQGWSIGMSSSGCDIVGVTTAGTAGAPVADGGLQNGGFEKTELTVDAAATNPAAGCPGNAEGAVSAVVLSFTMPITLDPGDSPHDIIQLTVEGVTPSVRETCTECRVFFQDDCIGSGQPVQNVITFGGATVPPGFADSATQLCAEAEAVGPCHEKDNVVFIVGETAASSGEQVGTIAEDVPLVVDVKGEPGSTVQAEVAAALVSKGLPSGAQGWSLSFVAQGDVAMTGVTTAGTAGAPVADGGLQNGGFEKTELTIDGTSPDAGCPSGEGAVSAVVLSFTMPITLSIDGTASVLGFTVENSVPIPEEGGNPVGGVVTCEDGCVGSGQPVQNVATVGGATNPLCNCQEIQVSFSPQTFVNLLSDYIRCDPNNDTRNDIADGIWIVNELFRGGPATECPAAADCSADGLVDLSDAAYAIAYQFQGGPPPSAPFPSCGTAPGDPIDDADFCPLGSTQCP